ncbi:hypothetical protein NL676_035052 [Syzygium grande]|nr:hypothetical protein NL676_035052 [Syzygium grande]
MFVDLSTREATQPTVLTGPLFTPPVNVTAAVKVAIQVAIDPIFSLGIVGIYLRVHHLEVQLMDYYD